MDFYFEGCFVCAKPLSFNKINAVHNLILISFRGDNVEDAFLDTAKKIYQNIQDGRYVLKFTEFRIDIEHVSCYTLGDMTL